MIHTTPLPHRHRDALQRVIRVNDYVVWSNKKKGMGLEVCSVSGSTEETVRIARLSGRLTNVSPLNLIVITAQVERNIEGNVGVNTDLESTR